MARTPEEIHAMFGTDPNWRDRQSGRAAAPTAQVAEQPQSDYASEYGQRQQGIHEQFGTDPNWRDALVTAAPEDDYGWGVARSLVRGFESVASIPDVLTGDYDELAEHFQRQKELARTPEDQKLMEEFDTKGFWEAGGWLLTHPRMMAQMFAESVPNFLPPIFGALAGGAGGAVAGSATGTPFGTAAGATWGGRAGFGVGSFAGEYARSVTEYLGEQGYDVTDPDQLRAAMSNPEISAGAREFAVKRGVPVAVAETLTFGLAGKFYEPVKKFLGNKVVGTMAGGTAETLAQATGGASGEAGAQLWSKGEIESPAQVMAEGLLEVPGAAIDPAIKYVTDPEFRASLKRDTGVENPDDSPLAALDRQGQETEETPESVDDTLGRLGEALSRELGEPIFPSLEEQRAAEQPMDPLDWQLQVLGETLERDLGAEQAKFEDMERLDQAEAAGREARRRQEAAAYEAQESQRIDEEIAALMQRYEQEQEQASQEVSPRGGQMVTPLGQPVGEQEPIDIIGGQPVEAMRVGEYRHEAGGRPFGTSLGEALRAAGVRPEVQQPPDDEGPGGGGGAAPLLPYVSPDAAPVPSARDTRIAEALEAEEAERQAREQDTEFDEESRFESEAKMIENAPVAVREPQNRRDGSVVESFAVAESSSGIKTVKFRRKKVGSDQSGPSTSAPMSPADLRPYVAEEDLDLFDETYAADDELAIVEVKIAERTPQFEEGYTSATFRVKTEDDVTENTWILKPEFGKAASELVEDQEADIDIPFTEDEMPPKPAVEWADERLADRTYHNALDRLISETEAGGGVAFIPDPNYIPGESDKRNDDGSYEVPTIRSSSVNPPWMQSIISNEGVGRPQIITAIEKAKEGKRLGERQKRIVQAMLDEIDSPSEYEAEQQAEQTESFEDVFGAPSAQQQAIEDERRRREERERAAPDVDTGAAGDLFTAQQTREQEQAQTDIEEAPAVLEAKDDYRQQIKLLEEGLANWRDSEANRRKAEKQLASLKRYLAGLESGIRFDVPKGTEFMDTAEAEKLADPNIPLPLLESQEGPYLDNFEKRIKKEGWKKPIQIVKTDKPYIYDGHHRLAVALRNNLPQVPVEWISEEEAQGVPIDATAAEERQELSEGERESIDNGHVAYVEKLRASGNAANSLVADIEDQNEKWRIFRAYEEDESWASDLPQDEIDKQNVRIDRLADMGDERAMRLAIDMDHWLYDDRIQAKSNHEKYVKSRKQNKYGGITDVRSRDDISLDAAQLSWNVPYDSLTFYTFGDKARLDRILEVGERAERNAATPGKEATGGKAEAEANTHVDAEGNVTFEIDEEQFNEVIDEYEHLQKTVPKSERKAIDAKLGNIRTGEPYEGFLSPEEAKQKVDSWKEHALSQRDAPSYRNEGDMIRNPEDNSQRVILSLFDYTGQWAQPYIDAGYDVYTFDIKTGQDILDFSREYFDENYNYFDGKEIYGILAACPCTTFTNSSTKWRKTRHDVKSKEMVAKMWGERAVEQGFEIPHEYGKELVERTLAVIEHLKPKFWALENPGGRIESSTSLRGWRTAFQPSNFGDPYTKRTFLWGNFNEDMPTANVDPVEGSKMHQMSPTEDRAALRAETPEGFSYAFFMANNYNDTAPEIRLPLEFNENAGAIRQALKAGLSEDQIRELIYNSYNNYEYEEVNEILREAIEGGPDTTPPEGGGAPILSPANEGKMTTDGFDLGYFANLPDKMDPNQYQHMFWGHGEKKEGQRLADSLSLVRVTFNKMFRGRPWYTVEARKQGGDEEGFAQVAEVRQRPKDKDGLEWAVYVDGKEVDRWHDFAHAAANVPGYTAESDNKWAIKDRTKFVEQKLGWRSGLKFSGVPPKVAPIPQFEVEERDGEYVKVGPKVEKEATPSLMDLARTVSSGGALAFNTRQKLKSMTVQELAKKHDQTDLQGYALKLGLDDKGNKIALAKRIKQAIESDVEVAAAEAAPDEATDAQKEAGNYKKGHLKKAGLDFAIENPEGTVRHGNLKLKDHYGYIKRTEGADGEQVDAFINPKMDEDFVGSVYIVDQMIEGEFDEHKVMFGYNNVIDARRAYKRNFNKDWTGDGPVTTMTMDEFKKWLSTDTTGPASESSVTEAGKKAREKKQKDLKFSVGKDMTNAPNQEFLEKVLKGDKHGDIPDTVPLNMVVSRLLEMRQAQAQPQQPAAGTFIDNLLEEEAARDRNIVKPFSKADEKKLDQIVAKFNKEFPLANIYIGNRNDPAVKKDVGDALENLTQFEAALDNLQVPGFYDPNTGKIWIFRDRLAINLMDAKKLILHEMTHRGLDVMFDMHEDPKGLIEFNRLMGDIYDRAPAKHKAKLKRIESQYGLDSTVREDNYQAAEELVAMLAESNVEDNLVARVIDFVRNFLERIGIITKEDAWTNEDIRALIAEAHGSLTGKQQLRKATIKEDVMLEDTGEVFEVETPATEALTAVNQRIKMCQRVRACL